MGRIAMLRNIPPGATPLEDADGLIPQHVLTKSELDELEFANMNQATRKYFLGKLTDKKAPNVRKSLEVGRKTKDHRIQYRSPTAPHSEAAQTIDG